MASLVRVNVVAPDVDDFESEASTTAEQVRTAATTTIDSLYLTIGAERSTVGLLDAVRTHYSDRSEPWCVAYATRLERGERGERLDLTPPPPDGYPV